MTEDEYHSHRNDDNGFCLACGNIMHGGIEPDARNYPCEVCGEPRVFGTEELMMMGKVAIIEEGGA